MAVPLCNNSHGILATVLVHIEPGISLLISHQDLVIDLPSRSHAEHMQITCRTHADHMHISCKSCADLTQISYNPRQIHLYHGDRADCMQITCRPHADCMQITCTPCADQMQIQYGSRTVHTTGSQSASSPSLIHPKCVSTAERNN